MKLTDYIKKLVRDYFIIFAIIIICTAVLRQIFSPDKYLELKDIFICMIGALLGDLPSIMFYSPKELSEKEMRIRIIIHFVVLEAGLLTFASIIGLVNGILPAIVLAFQIAVIYVFVRFLSWMDDKKAADRINEILKAMKDGASDEMEEK